MSLLALAAAYDSDSDSNDSKNENEVNKREVGKGQDTAPPLKRGLDQVLDKEMKKEIGDEEEIVKLESKKTKNIVKEQNLEESLNVLVPKEEPKKEYGELEAGIGKEEIPGSSVGEPLLKRELKVEYSEFGIEAGVCKQEPKVELEEGEIQEPKEEYGELGAGMGMQQTPGSSFDPVSLTEEPKKEYSEFGIGDGKQQTHCVSFDVCKKEPKDELEEGEIQEPKVEYGELEAGLGKHQIPGASFGEVSLKREPKEEYSELEADPGREQNHGDFLGVHVCKKEPKVELGVRKTREEQIDFGSYDVGDIIAGRERISFLLFKELVEYGRLTREDLSVMRSARVIEVPGMGEVIQFMSPRRDRNLQDFNKIDLKELDLDEVCIIEEKWEQEGKQTWVEVSEMFRKKGTTFLCNSCNTIHPNVERALSHIDAGHPESGFLMSKKNQRIAEACLRYMCDPSMMFQHVEILDLETRKKYLKTQESNIYESAAELLSNMVDVKWAQVKRRTGGLEFTCKLCGNFSVAVKNGRLEMIKRYYPIRKRFVEHLTDVHHSNCQSLASQLEVAPDEKLKDLLFEALWPDLHDVWSKMMRLHYE